MPGTAYRMRSGTSIDKEILDQIFDPLKRGLGQRNVLDDEPGLGLGLYIVREIAHAHGGEVNVQSDNAETVFAVRLPCSINTSYLVNEHAG